MQSLTETLGAMQEGTVVRDRVENISEPVRMHVEYKRFFDLAFVNCHRCTHHYDADLGTTHYCERGRYLFQPRECNDFENGGFLRVDWGYKARRALKFLIGWMFKKEAETKKESRKNLSSPEI